MSPDSQQPQNAPVLPEVPQVTPIQPAPQPVEVTPQPVVPPQVEQLPVQPVPVAPEVPVLPVAPVTPTPAVETPQPAFQAPEPTPVVTNSQFPQTLPTQNLPTSPVTMPQVAQPKKKLGLLIGAIVGGLVVIGGLVALLVLFVLPSGKIAESDLVSSITDGTSYLRPKQWQSTTVSSASGYGDMKAKDNKSTSAIFTKKSSYIYSNLTKLSSDKIASFRDTVTKAVSTSDAEGYIKESGSCTSVKDVTTTKSTISNSDLLGIFRIDGTCTQDNGSFKVVYIGAVGNDGYARTIVLVATESLWKQNEAIYNKMINSVNQI